MPIRSSVVSQVARPFSSYTLADQAQVRVALEWLEKNVSWINDEQSSLTEIPAPSFQEQKRAAAMKALLAEQGLTVQSDKIGNVIGELRGASDKEIVMLTAHLDTVFPEGTDVRVKQEGERLVAPGISDNGTGLAALLGIARAHAYSQSATATHDFVRRKRRRRRRRKFARDARVDRCLPDKIARGDCAGRVWRVDHVTTKALASRRVEVVITGPGGHSWSDFGIPNPISALVRGSVRFHQHESADVAANDI